MFNKIYKNKMKIIIICVLAALCLSWNADSMEQSQKDEPYWFTLTDIYNLVAETFGFEEVEIKKDSNQELTMSERYKRERDELIHQDKASYFTKDVQALTYKELQVQDKLNDLREKVVQGDHSPLKLDFYEGKKIVESSEVYKAIRKIPKGAHLHLHTTAAVPLDTMMSFTNEDYVYYSFKDNLLKAAPQGIADPSYQKWNAIRKDWKQEGTFDEFLRNKIKLTAEEMANKESNSIWEKFQFKFSLVSGMVAYKPLYRKGILAICQNAIDENVSIVEIRHTSGKVFDESGQKLTLDQEFEIYYSVIDEIRKSVPYFELRIIISSAKSVSREKVLEQLENYKYSKSKFSIVSGFDLVAEEDITPPLTEFVDDLEKYRQIVPEFELYLHAGESTSRYNENLYDAILLGTKRIGHGLAIEFHPYLTQVVKDKNIGYEICPISNFVLGYTLDFRWHPIRSLMAKGISVTLSSDDPSFWDYNGLTLDFTYAFLGWELDLKDLKQLAINSVKQSSLNEAETKKLLKSFYEQWDRFIDDFSNDLLVSE